MALLSPWVRRGSRSTRSSTSLKPISHRGMLSSMVSKIRTLWRGGSPKMKRSAPKYLAEASLPTTLANDLLNFVGERIYCGQTHQLLMSLFYDISTNKWVLRFRSVSEPKGTLELYLHSQESMESTLMRLQLAVQNMTR